MKLANMSDNTTVFINTRLQPGGENAAADKPLKRF
jgi:hypothetical protein